MTSATGSMAMNPSRYQNRNQSLNRKPEPAPEPEPEPEPEPTTDEQILAVSGENLGATRQGMDRLAIIGYSLGHQVLLLRRYILCLTTRSKMP